MMTKLILAGVLGALAITPAWAGDDAAQSSGKACLQVGRIYNWNAPDNRTLIVENDLHKKFKVDLMGTCSGLTFKQTLAFRSPGGTQLSCLSAGDTVFFRDTGIGNRCYIKSVSHYTAQMEAADKAAKDAAKHKDHD
jgi:hypothetical protein